MDPSELTPEERFEVQAWYVRAWRARRRRALYHTIRVAPARATYDVAGHRVARFGVPSDGRITTLQEDRA